MSSQPNNDEPRIIPMADAPSFDISALTREKPTDKAAEPAVPFVQDPAVTDRLKPEIVAAISKVFDPEIPVNIYELGLVYDIDADADANVRIRMTLTAPSCPSAQQIPQDVKYRVKAVEGVKDVTVDVVWDPPWTKDMMSEAAKLTLGLF